MIVVILQQLSSVDLASTFVWLPGCSWKGIIVTPVVCLMLNFSHCTAIFLLCGTVMCDRNKTVQALMNALSDQVCGHVALCALLVQVCCQWAHGALILQGRGVLFGGHDP